ncbi:MAG: hypothetical protein JJU48_10800 [Methylophaga sp.]|nr:hypothetical protein [Methylophaga sp.]
MVQRLKKILLQAGYADDEPLPNLQVLLDLERGYIARELHDELGQQLSLIHIYASALLGEEASEDVHDYAARIDRLVLQARVHIRELLTGLRQGDTDEFDFDFAMEQLCYHWQCKTLPISFFFSIDEKLGDVDNSVLKALYRIIQAAITNIVRHSRADKASITLSADGEVLHLQVRDNGIGFDVHSLSGDGLGLLGMRERVEILKGSMVLNTQPQNGCSIEISVPKKVNTDAG